MIFDPTKSWPYIIFIQIMLVRDRKLQDGFQLPASTPPLERARTMHQQLPMSPYIHPESSDLGITCYSLGLEDWICRIK